MDVFNPKGAGSLFLALCLVFLFSGCASSPRSGVPSKQAQALTYADKAGGVSTAAAIGAAGEIEARLADLDSLCAGLRKRHPVFRETSPDAKERVGRFNSAASALRGRLPGMRPDEAVVGLAALVAGLGDEHTNLVIPAVSMLPLDLYEFKEGVYLTGSPADRPELLGKRLLAINGVPIEELRAGVSTILAHGNESWLSCQAPYRYLIPDILSGLGLIPPGVKRLRLSLGDELGSVSELELKAVTEDDPDPRIVAATPASLALRGAEASGVAAGEPPLSSQRTREAYWCELVPGTQTLYLAYNSCREDPKHPMSDFVKEIEARLASGSVDRVLVDLRRNGGGSSPLFWPMERLLSRYALRPARGRAAIPVYVAIGRRTFSSAVLNAIELRQGNSIPFLAPSSKAIFVGEASGGSPNHYGDKVAFSLPNSGIRVQCSTKRFTMWKGPEADSLEPDHAIPVTWADWNAGVDPVIDFVTGVKP